MTIRSDAALTSRVTGARMVTTLAVLGGILGLTGLGVLGDLSATSTTGPTLVTVELSQPLAR